METPIEHLKTLPKHSEETWQGGLIRMPGWIAGAGPAPYRAYIPMWVAVRADKVHGGQLLRPEERDLTAAVEALLAFASEDEFGGYRPGRVEVTDPALAEHLAKLLTDADIEVNLVERMEAVERVIDAMAGFGEGERKHVPGPLEGEGVTVERMRRFAEAAAAFYRKAPWQYLTDTDLICTEQPEPPQGMECCVVLGAGRAVYGLGFYSSLDDYVSFRRAAGDARRTSLEKAEPWQVSFDPITEIPFKDADLWEDHGLPVADKRAYPLAMRYGSRGRMSRPGATELCFLEALFRAFADTSEAEIDSGRWQKEVVTHDGPFQMTLAIPDLLKPPSPQDWIKRGFSPDRRAHERMFADMDRYFREHPPADMDEMNTVLQGLFSGRKVDDLVTQPETPLERSQELCCQAFATPGRRRVQLARQALEICPDCADAYVILAEQAGTLESEFDYYAKAVAASERSLGPETFKQDVGHFWGISATRPYMRARLGLAQALEQSGRIEEAVEHYHDLLRLNPNDNQGVRYLLMPRLMELGRDAEAARLLKEFQEESANWAYARALLAFRLSGKSTAARRELREALRTNSHVPEFLLEEGPLPMPEHYSPGSPEEAVICAEELHPAFVRTEGALEWLAAEHKQRQKEMEARRKDRRRKDRQRRTKRKR